MALGRAGRRSEGLGSSIEETELVDIGASVGYIYQIEFVLAFPRETYVVTTTRMSCFS